MFSARAGVAHLSGQEFEVCIRPFASPHRVRHQSLSSQDADGNKSRDCGQNRFVFCSCSCVKARVGLLRLIDCWSSFASYRTIATQTAASTSTFLKYAHVALSNLSFSDDSVEFQFFDYLLPAVVDTGCELFPTCFALPIV